jgi:predicted SprT family Zn-dependent metalloprotease
LASWLARGDQHLRLEVLCHELAHIALHERHGRHARAHGKEWAALVRAAGFSPTARLDQRQTGSRVVPDSVSSPPQPRAIYRHRCPVCQMERRARRPVRRWLCRGCIEAGLEGNLEIERLAARDAPTP